MNESPAAVPRETVAALRPPLLVPRWLAALEVVLVCGIPTQVFVLVMLFLLGQPLPTTTNVPLTFFASLSLFDTALIALLIRLFLGLSGESSETVFIGRRPVWGEIIRGLAFVPLAFLLATGLVAGLRWLVPSLHTVDQNPLLDYMSSPVDAIAFAVVVVLAGGVREELQRAFILHRFGQSLGGVWVGLGVYGLLFGGLHYDQGLDAAIAVGVLGFCWGGLYIWRRSAVASIACHAGFDAVQVLQGVLARVLSH